MHIPYIATLIFDDEVRVQRGIISLPDLERCKAPMCCYPSCKCVVPFKRGNDEVVA